MKCKSLREKKDDKFPKYPDFFSLFWLELTYIWYCVYVLTSLSVYLY